MLWCIFTPASVVAAITCKSTYKTDTRASIAWWHHQTFCVTGPLCGKFTGHWWIPSTKASDAKLWCFFGLCLNKRLSKQSWGWWWCNGFLEHIQLIHWGGVTHICVSDLTSIGSDNGLSPGRCQAIIRTNAGILLIRPLGTNFSEFLVEILIFSFKKMRLKLSSAKGGHFVSASMS